MQIAKSVLRPLGRWLPLAGLAGCLAVMLSIGGPVRADRLPLPPGKQAVVNGAIDRGVLALRASQFPDGSWAAPNKGHRAGYAALPALTLLECGVPPNDPAVQRAAFFVRHHSLK